MPLLKVRDKEDLGVFLLKCCTCSFPNPRIECKMTSMQSRRPNFNVEKTAFPTLGTRDGHDDMLCCYVGSRLIRPINSELTRVYPPPPPTFHTISIITSRTTSENCVSVCCCRSFFCTHRLLFRVVAVFVLASRFSYLFFTNHEPFS